MINLENCIFKYGPANHVERTLSDRTLSFAKLNSYNDIYEDEFHLILNIRRENVEAFNQKTIKPAVRIRSIFEKELANYSITCFSQRADIALMWSHYADKHEGVCYCFDLTAPSPIFESPIDFGPVKYSSSLPEINVYQEHTTDAMIRRMASDVVLTKPTEWAYEKEIRFWYNSELGENKYDPQSLKAIIVGRRMKAKQLEDLEKVVDDYNKAQNTEVEILYMHRRKQDNKLGICDQQLKRDWSEVSQNNSSVITVSKEGKPLLSVKDG